MSNLRIDISDLGVSPDRGGRVGGGDAETSGMAGARTRGWGRRVGWALALSLIGASVPFVLLLRGSVHAHAAWELGPWASVGVGLGYATAAIGAALWLVSRLLKVPGGLRRLLARAGMLLSVVFVGYGVLYIGARNVKGDAVRAEYRALHPLLRVASTVLVLVDRDAVVTDTRREPADYVAMGLSPLEASRHYAQADGYVHALDLRTLGRPEWRNRTVEWGFRSMGFMVLRHEGTADHLHVSLPRAGEALGP
jgi:hypothetical protein